MYSLAGHGDMIEDRVRMAAYQQALAAVVRPGCVVADIGAGSGILSLLACRLGAGRVYAIEPADIIEVARRLAVANGCADRISFLQDFSTHVTLPQPADVVVADLRGILPWFQHNIPALIDARTRLLARDGALIPQRDVLRLAVVDAPQPYARITDAWDRNGLSFDLGPAKQLMLNNWRKGRFTASQLLTEPQTVAALDYATTTEINLDTLTPSVVTRSGTGHGFCAWFDTVLTGAVGFSNAPGGAELLYGQAFFPWPEPVELSVGERVTVHLSARLVGDDYVWNWETAIHTGGAAPAKLFRQSTFFGIPVVPAVLRRGAADFVPVLGPEGASDRLVLSLMDGKLTVADIASRVAEQYPDRFPQPADALTRVGELARKYAR